MDDWTPSLSEPTDAPITEEFDPTWLYNFKWGFNIKTGEAHVWRVKGGTDGRPTHRAELRELWGREPQVREGDVMGLAEYIPAEVKLDGTIVAPPLMKVEAYYGQDVPVGVFDWIEANFPGVVATRARLASAKYATDWKPSMGGDEQVKWVWNANDGLLIWVTDQAGYPHHDEKLAAEWGRSEYTNPLDYLGAGNIFPGEIQISTYKFGTPRQALAEVKAKLAEMFPESEILLPDIQEDHEALGVEFSGDPDRLARYDASAVWAQENVGQTPLPPAPARPLPVMHRKQGLFVNPLPAALRKLFRRRQKTAEADMTGAMIALWIPEEVGEKLKLEGGEPVSNMHITLAYFEDKATDRDDWDVVAKIVEEAAKRQKTAMPGKIGGYGIFNNPDGDVLWASTDIPHLAELRHELVDTVEKAGFPVSKEHGFTPHVTVKYEFDGELPKLEKPLELTFDTLTFARGENYEHFTLGGGFEKEADNGLPRIPVIWNRRTLDCHIGSPGDEHGDLYELHGLYDHEPNGEPDEDWEQSQINFDPETGELGPLLNPPAPPIVSSSQAWRLREMILDKVRHRLADSGGFEKEAGDDWLAWEGYQGPQIFVTDGKEILTDPGDDRQALWERFREFHPDSEHILGGQVVPTEDGMGYEIHPSHHRPEPGLHEVMAILDDHLGKPTHFAGDRRA